MQGDAVDRRVKIDVSWMVFVRLAVAGIVGGSLWMLRGFLLTFLLAVLLAVTLQPFVQWLQRRRFSHGASVAATAVLLLCGLLLMFELVLPPLIAQVSGLFHNLGSISTAVQGRLGRVPAMRRLVQQLIDGVRHIDFRTVLTHGWLVGQAVVQGISWLVLLLVLSVYLLLDGTRLYAWLLSFAPHRFRPRVRATAMPVAHVMRAYVRGQFTTSAICTVYSYIVLEVLRVPAALPLAVLAGLLDIIPLLGVIIAITPAVLLALTVSNTAALLVIALYVLYHQVESYFISPRVYGRELRLSSLATLLATIVGGILAGIPGIVLALPIAAVFPTIEQLWLADRLSEETVEDHADLNAEGESEARRAAERLTKGEGSGRGPDSTVH